MRKSLRIHKGIHRRLLGRQRQGVQLPGSLPCAFPGMIGRGNGSTALTLVGLSRHGWFSHQSNWRIATDSDANRLETQPLPPGISQHNLPLKGFSDLNGSRLDR